MNTNISPQTPEQAPGVRIELPHELELRPYQKPLWNAAVIEGWNRIMTVWPRRNGKDLIWLNIAIARAMQRQGLYFYIAPYYTQVKSIIWRGSDASGKRFLDYIPDPLFKKKYESDLMVELVNGSLLRFLGSDNIDSIVGNNPLGVVFTEFSLHKPDAWHYLRPVLAENGGWAGFNGTPRGLNHMFTQFQYAATSPDWWIQYLTREDTGVPTDEAIEADRRSGMPESLIQQEYFCSWTASSEEVLIPLDIIQPRLSTKLPNNYLEKRPREPKIMGVDVAFATLGDQAVIAKRQGRFLHPLEKYQGKDNVQLAAIIAKDIEIWKPDRVYIDWGRGEGVIHTLHNKGYSNVVHGVNFGGKPTTILYNNRRTEMYCRMRDWYSNEDAPPLIPHDEELISGTSAPTFDMNDKNQVQLESKKNLKKRGATGFDEADAVALTFAEEEVRVGIEGQHPDSYTLGGVLEHRRTYDPLSYLDDENEYEYEFSPNSDLHNPTDYI